MGLQSQLREQSRCALPHMTPPQKTMVLAWWKWDSPADNLCQAIPQAFCSLYKPCPVGTERELTNRLLRMKKSAWNQAAPIYLIWVWGQSPAPDLHSVMQSLQEPFQPVIVDVCRANDTADVWPGGYRYGYRIASDAAQAADELLSLFMLEAAGRGALDLPPARQIFQLSTTLYNSIERDLLRQLAGRLRSLLTIEQSLWDERFTSAFGPSEEDLDRLYQLLPHPMDLPIPGARRLAALLTQKERSFFAVTSSYVDITVQEALETFFGISGGQAVPEYLRSVLPQNLHSLCEGYLKGLALEQRCYQQPICILQNGLYLVSCHKESIRRRREANQEKYCKILSWRFTPRGTGFYALLEAMNDYLTIWEECIYCELEDAWWDVIGKIFNPGSKIMRRAKAAYECLSAGLRIAVGLNDTDAGGIPIDWCGKTPESILSGLSSQAEFSRNEIVKIIQNAQKQADRQVPAAGMRETWILYGGDLNHLNNLEDQGRPVFCEKGQGLAIPGAMGHLSILSFQDARMGRYILWEIHITPSK